MDSGNSGSLQSSSGPEEECDSRAVVDSIGSLSSPAFITNNHHNPPPFNNHHHHHLIFDQNQINNNHHNHHPLFFSSPQTPLLNLDNSVVWSKTLPPSSSSSPDQINNTHHPFYNTSVQPDHQFQHQFTPPVTTTTTTNTTTAATTPATSTNPLPVRNPKKRSRASRGAPTTVLTTDTSNFRAMVQEFTGIPAPPFTSSSSSSPFPRLTRFDLFGTPSTIRSHPHNNFDNPPQLLPPYLLRPFPQKLQPPPPPPSSCSSSSSSSISSLLNPNISNMQNSISIPSNFLNQSLSFLNNSKPVPTSNEFGLVHGLQPSMPELVSADRTATAPPRNDNQAANWGCSSGGGQGLNPTYTNGKGSAAAGDHHVPGLRSEGLMEPWICSSSD